MTRRCRKRLDALCGAVTHHPRNKATDNISSTHKTPLYDKVLAGRHCIDRALVRGNSTMMTVLPTAMDTGTTSWTRGRWTSGRCARPYKVARSQPGVEVRKHVPAVELHPLRYCASTLASINRDAGNWILPAIIPTPRPHVQSGGLTS